MSCTSTAQIANKVGRLWGHKQTNQEGLYLKAAVWQDPSVPLGTNRCSVTAFSPQGDLLAVATTKGSVCALHLNKNRYTLLDESGASATSATFMARLTRRLFVAFSNGSIRCYDINKSSQVATFKGHRSAVTSLSVKVSTEQLASASADGVLLWDVPSLRLKRILGDAPYGTCQAVVTPDEKTVVAAAPSGTITVWNAATLQQQQQFQIPKTADHPSVLSCIAVSPNCQQLLVGCNSPARLLVYTLQPSILKHGIQLPDSLYSVVQLQYLPDSLTAAVLTGDGNISFIDTTAARITVRMHLNTPGCRAESFTMDERANNMAVVCNDGLVHVYDLSVVRKQQAVQPPMQLQILPAELLLSQDAAARAAETSAEGEEAGDNVTGQRAGTGAAATDPNVPTAVLSEVQNISNLPPAQAAKASSKQGVKKVKGRSQSAGRRATAAAGDAQAAAILQHGVRASSSRLGLEVSKLKQILMVYGEFPARYRLLIWDHMLQLPHHHTAFQALEDQGIHAAYTNLSKQLPATSPTLVKRLQKTLSELAHWCPLFGEAAFMPSIAFPFVRMFGPNLEGAFELIATLLMNWCKGWFEMFPNPPVALLRKFMLVLTHHDGQLGNHLAQHRTMVVQHVWVHLSTLMVDCFDKDAWLSAWDHCLSAGPNFQYLLLAAYLIHFRGLLLAATSKQQLQRFFTTKHPLDIHKVIRKAYTLQQSTPDHMYIAPCEFTPLSKDGNAYPLFFDYPTGSVEIQRMERQKIQEAEDALIRRRQLLAELEVRSKQVAFQAGSLTAERQQLLHLDQQRRAAARAAEVALAAENSKLEDKAKEQKLKQIKAVEEAYQTSLSQLRSDWQQELARLKEDVEHRKRLMAHSVKARQEDEDIRVLEFQAQQRLWSLEQDMLNAAGTSELQDQLVARQAALDAEARRKAAEWDAQDEARRLTQQHEAARRARVAVAAEKAAAQEAAQAIMLANELEAQEKLLKVEHARVLRQLAEDQAELTAKVMEVEADRDRLRAKAAETTTKDQAAAQQDWYTDQQRQRLAALDAERTALQRRQEQMRAIAADLDRAGRLAVATDKLSQIRQGLQEADEEEQEEARKLLAVMKQGRKYHDEVQQLLQDMRKQGLALDAAAAGNLSTAAAAAAATAAGVGTVRSQERPSHQQPAVSKQPAAAAGTAGQRGLFTASSPTPSSISHTTFGVEELETEISALRAEYAARRARLEQQYEEEVDAEIRELLGGQAKQAGAATAAAITSSKEGVGVAAGAQKGANVNSRIRQGDAGGDGDAVKSAPEVMFPSAPSSIDLEEVNLSAELDALMAEIEADNRVLSAYKRTAEPKQLRPGGAATGQAQQASTHTGGVQFSTARDAGGLGATITAAAAAAARSTSGSVKVVGSKAGKNRSGGLPPVPEEDVTSTTASSPPQAAAQGRANSAADDDEDHTMTGSTTAAGSPVGRFAHRPASTAAGAAVPAATNIGRTRLPPSETLAMAGLSPLTKQGRPVGSASTRDDDDVHAIGSSSRIRGSIFGMSARGVGLSAAGSSLAATAGVMDARIESSSGSEPDISQGSGSSSMSDSHTRQLAAFGITRGLTGVNAGVQRDVKPAGSSTPSSVVVTASSGDTSTSTSGDSGHLYQPVLVGTPAPNVGAHAAAATAATSSLRAFGGFQSGGDRDAASPLFRLSGVGGVDEGEFREQGAGSQTSRGGKFGPSPTGSATGSSQGTTPSLAFNLPPETSDISSEAGTPGPQEGAGWSSYLEGSALEAEGMLPESGRRSGRLEHSSSATSEELEQLLQHLSSYEAQLQADLEMPSLSLHDTTPQLQPTDESADTGTHSLAAAAWGGLDAQLSMSDVTPASGRSDDVTPASSVSWSQTLRSIGAGLESLLGPGWRHTQEEEQHDDEQEQA